MSARQPSDPPHDRRPPAAADAVREDAHRFRTTFDLAPVGLAHVALSGEWLAVNRRLCALLGYERDELLRLRFQDITHPDDLSADLDQALRLVAGEIDGYELVKRYLRKDGTAMWARLTGTLVRDEHGAAFHFIAAVEALSEVERAEAERRTAAAAVEAQRLAFALDGASDGLWDWNVRTGAVYLSPSWCRLLGYAREELAPDLEGLLALVHPDDLPAVRDALEAQLAGRTPMYEAEHRTRHRDGRWVWTLSRGRVVLRDAEGRALRAVGTTSDIDGRRSAEAAVRDRERRLARALADLEVIYDSASVGLAVLDCELRYTRVNAKLATMNGVAAEAHLGRSVAEVVPSIADRIVPLLERVRDTGTPVAGLEFRTAMPGAPGEVRDWSVDYYPIRDADGAVVGINAAVAEITQQKRVQEALRGREARLRTLVDRMPLGMHVLDALGATVSVNATFERLFGIGAADLATHNVWAGPHYLPDGARALVPRVYAGETVHFPVIRHVPPHGDTVRAIELLGYPLRDDAGAVREVVLLSTDVTAREEAAAALRASEAFARGVLDASPDCVKTLDLAGRLLTMNAGGCALMEVDDVDAIRGTDWCAFWTEGGTEPQARSALRAAVNGGTARFQGACPTLKGTLKWWDVEVAPILGADGCPERVLSVSRDITALKETEQALRAREIQLRCITESGIVGVMYCRADGPIVEANDALLAMLGHDRAALARGALDWRRMTPPGWEAVDARALDELRTRGAATPFEKEYLRADGTPIPVLLSVAGLTDTADTVVCLVQDLTTRRATEGALAQVLAGERRARADADRARAEAERRSRETEALADVMRDLMSHTALDEVLRRVTHHTRALLGAGYAAVATVAADGTSRWLAMEGNQSDAWRDVAFAPDVGTAARVVATAAPLVIQDFPDDPSFPPERFPVHAVEGMRSALGVPLVTGDGRAFGALIVGWRERIAVDARAIALATALARPASVAIENAKLVRELQRASAEAEAASRAKSEFLATMSHELRTPLNAIQGYTQLIELGVRGPVTAEQRADLARIQQSQRHLLGLINDVLNFSKIEAGHVTYDIAAVPLAEVAAEVLPMVAPQAAAKGIVLDVEPMAPTVVVRADRAKLAQVLLNLLGNAVKFTPAGGRVTVDTATRDPAGDGDDDGPLYLRVTDTGPGIAREQQDAVFEPFVQVPSGYADRHDGTGLGLAISRDLARGMGGDLRLRSAPGEGATFTVTLPRA